MDNVEHLHHLPTTRLIVPAPFSGFSEETVAIVVLRLNHSAPVVSQEAVLA